MPRTAKSSGTKPTAPRQPRFNDDDDFFLDDTSDIEERLDAQSALATAGMSSGSGNRDDRLFD